MEDDILIINQTSFEVEEMQHGHKIHHKRKNFTGKLTTNKIVASQYEIPPGKASWPFHYHLANEEVFYILEGEGELRTLNKTIKVSTGDFIRFPIGEKGAHQLINTSRNETLKYLDFGTTNHPDLVFMPDSNKVGLFGGGAPCQNNKKRIVWKYFDLNSEIGYLDGE